MLDGQRAIVEAELLLLQLARDRGTGVCEVCVHRPRIGHSVNGVPNADALPCMGCGWMPWIRDIQIVYGDPPPLLWLP